MNDLGGARVLVTGASGFVGRPLCVGLTEAGCTVRAVSRAPSALAWAGDVHPVAGIDGHTDWDTALVGVSAVVHLAARVHRLSDDAPDAAAAYERVNTAGTLRLAAAAAAAGCRRFVFLSTVKVLGEAGRFRGEGAGQPPADPYGLSKYDAEQGLRRIAETSGMKVVCLRPPLVYGPGVKANFLRLMNWVHCGLPLPLGAVKNRRSLVYVGNLVDAIVRCLTADSVPGFAYSVTDGDDVSTAELIRRIGRAMGKPARLIRCPVRILNWGGALTGKGAEVHRLVQDLAVTYDAFCTDFDWTPPFTMDKGIQETVDWYMDNRN
ncbi:MAG: NAD-dependent epimerase/dehydratase family protein [Pseudomonadota bacterium]